MDNKIEILRGKEAFNEVSTTLNVPKKALKGILKSVVRELPLNKTECLNLLSNNIETLKLFSKKQKYNSTYYIKITKKYLKQKNCFKPISGLAQNAKESFLNSLALFLFKIRKLAPKTKMC